MGRHLAADSGSAPHTSVALRQLRAEAARYPGDPYLITVTADGAPHCSPVPVEWSGEQLLVPAPRRWLPPSSPRSVSLLYPPASPSGYALIVDGVTGDPGPRLSLSISRAVLHRRGAPDPGHPDGACGSDCIPLLPPG